MLKIKSRVAIFNQENMMYYSYMTYPHQGEWNWISHTLPSEIDESKFLEVKVMTPSDPGSVSALSVSVLLLVATSGAPAPDTMVLWNKAKITKTHIENVLDTFILLDSLLITMDLLVSLLPGSAGCEIGSHYCRRCWWSDFSNLSEFIIKNSLANGSYYNRF